MSLTFPIEVPVRNTGNHQESISQWARAMRAHCPIGPLVWEAGTSPYTEKPVLVHAPENIISYPIAGPDGAILFPERTPLRDIVLDPATEYQWRGHPVDGADLRDILDSFFMAVRVFVHVHGERHFVGYLPEQIAHEVYDQLDVVYPGRLKLTEREVKGESRHGLSIEIRKRRDAGSSRSPRRS